MQFSSSVRISVTHYNVKCLIFIKNFLSAAREFENIFDGNFLQYVNQVLRSTRKYEFISQKASCAGTVALSAHMGLSLFKAHSISLSVRNGQFYFHLIINSFIFTTRHYSQLFITIRHYSSLFITIRHYSSLFITIHHYSSPFITIRHYSSLFVTIHHYSSLFVTIHHYSSLFITIRDQLSLFVTIRDYSQYSVVIRVLSLANDGRLNSIPVSFPVPAFSRRLLYIFFYHRYYKRQVLY